MSWLESLSNMIKTSLESKLDRHDAQKIFAKKTDLFSKKYSDLNGLPNISDVGLSGKYGDLLNKPTNLITIDEMKDQPILNSDGEVVSFDHVFDGYGLIRLYLLRRDEDLEIYMDVLYYLEQGAPCISVKTNLKSLGLTGDLYSNIFCLACVRNPVTGTDTFVISAGPSYGGGKIFYADDSGIHRETVDGKSVYSIEFHKGNWPENVRAFNSIACAKVSNKSVYVATPSGSTYLNGEYVLETGAYISNDLNTWVATDLRTFEYESFGYVQKYGYRNVIVVTGRDYNFVSFPNAENYVFVDDDQIVGYSSDGEHWEYAPISSISNLTSCRVIQDLNRSINRDRFIMFNETGIYESDDLSTWSKIFDGNYSNVSFVSSSYDDDANQHCLITVGQRTGYLKNFERSIEIERSVFAKYDYGFKGWGIYSIASEREHETWGKHINTKSMFYKFALLDSSFIPTDVTEKVAEYIVPYIIDQKILNDHINSLIDAKLEEMNKENTHE